MRHIILLVKNNFLTTFGVNKILKIDKGRLLLYLIFILYVVWALLNTSYNYSDTVAKSLLQYNLLGFMITIFFIITSFSIFMFTIYNSKNSLFNAKDNDLLLSMPIKTETILASRLINLLLWNLLTAIVFIGPAIFVYVHYASVSLLYYLKALIIFIMLPIIPTILASIVGYVIAYLTSKSNIKNWFEIIISFIFVFALFYVMSNGEKIINFIADDISKVETILKWGFYPVYLVNEMFTNDSYLSLFEFIAINIGLLYLFIKILNRNFKRIIIKLQENKTKVNYVLKELKVASVSKALLIKEFRRYFSSPIYVLNTSFGIVMLFIMAIGTMIYDKSEILTLAGMNSEDITSFQIVLLITAFVAFVSNTTASSISLEGKNFWIMKSLPVEPKKILNSKILLNLIITLPITFISIIIFKFTLALTIVEVLLLFIITTISVLVSAHFGLLVNLKFPKMDAINDATVVKRSVSSMVSMILPIAIIFTIAGVYSEIGSFVGFNVMIIFIVISLIILLIFERILLNNWAVRRFREID